MKKHFITGLVILLPLVVTIAVVIFLVNFLTEPFMGVVSAILAKFNIINKGFLFLSPEKLIRYGSKVIILILLFLVTVALGMVARWFFVNTLFRLGDKILHRIPIVNTVYKTTQDIIKTLFVSDKNTFKQVVMVPFPRADVFVLGLIARESPTICSQAAGHDLISVFVPTTPNPTTGFLLMFKRSDLVIIDMKPEDAIKYIVSCGVIIPESKGSTATAAHS
ncbi:MAG: DUF502 domain-containing protein [Verrucomicrobia bacterium]|nr:DUF502 domain-containing protein [Verrucomicrobiota bacterium]